MRIAVNTKYMSGQLPENFIYEVFKRIVKNNPQHEFVFIYEKTKPIPELTEKNVSVLELSPARNSPFFWKLWYEVNLPYLLHKQKIDLLVSATGFGASSVKIPQCLIINNLDFIQFPERFNISKRLFLKRLAKKSISQAKTVITTSQFLKNEILKFYSLSENKTVLIHSAADGAYQPIGFEGKQSVKEKFTDSAEYFVYSGSAYPHNNMLNLLKAFSIFKKRQKSNWKLVLVFNDERENKSLPESLKTYKYRNDVVLVDKALNKELALIIASAYAFINPSDLDGFNLAVIESMASGVPVIAIASDEIDQEAALFFNAANVTELADQMMLIYKDENLRNKLIIRGSEMSKQFNWDKSAEVFWGCIEKTIG
jgi:glycosyltransferase involved in cell wall biosynthesis